MILRKHPRMKHQTFQYPLQAKEPSCIPEPANLPQRYDFPLMIRQYKIPVVLFVQRLVAANLDLHSYDSSANFCIKGLVPKTSDLDCQNSISWEKITPGTTVVSNFSIKNLGESFSKLDWQITEYPSWGNWSFSRNNGSGLLPEQGEYNITVTVGAPLDENTKFSGEIKVVNKHDTDDYEIIIVTLTTPTNTAMNNQLVYFFEQQPNFFTVLQRFSFLRSLFVS